MFVDDLQSLLTSTDAFQLFSSTMEQWSNWVRMIIRQEKGCAFFSSRDLRGLRVDARAPMWLRTIGDASLQDQNYHLLAKGEVYVALGFGYSVEQDYRPIWNALFQKIDGRVQKMVASVASTEQKIRFIRETISGTLNYTCGECPIFPVAALSAIDIALFRWTKQLLGLGRRGSIARGVVVKPAAHGGMNLVLPSAQCMSTALTKYIRHLHEDSPYGALLRDGLRWGTLSWSALQVLWPGATPRETSCAS